MASVTLTYNSAGHFTHEFEVPVISSSLRAVKTEQTGKGGHIAGCTPAENFLQGDTTCCRKIIISIGMNTLQWIPLAPNVGAGGGYYINVPSSVTVEITAQDYTPATAPPDEPYNGGEILEEIEPEYEEQDVLVTQGLNLKCIDEYHKITLGYGEIRADESIINPLIPDREAAIRIGKYYIFKTGKTEKAITQGIVPNLEMEPLDTTYVSLSIPYIFRIVEIEKISYNMTGPTDQSMEIYYTNLDRVS
ncbi:MAG: hypothetical protein WC309_03580 [Candidatus Paceibacterota bacterium]|jgi:hypothetical protein